MTENTQDMNNDVAAFMESEKFISEVSGQLDTMVKMPVYKKGLRGRITRGLLSGISGLSVNKTGRIVTNALGLKKVLRWNTKGAITKDELEIAQNLKQVRKLDRLEERMVSKGYIAAPGSDNILNEQRQALHDDRKIMTEGLAYTTREELLEAGEPVYAPSTLKVMQEQAKQQKQFKELLAKTDPKNIYHVVTNVGTCTPVIQEEDNFWSIEEAQETIEHYASLSEEDRKIVRDVHDNADISEEEFKDLDDDEKKDYNDGKLERSAMQYMIDHIEVLDVAYRQAQEIVEGKIPESVQLAAPVLTTFFRENMIASKELENVRMIPVHIAQYLGMDLENDPDLAAKAKAEVNARLGKTQSDIPAVEALQAEKVKQENSSVYAKISNVKMKTKPVEQKTAEPETVEAAEIASPSASLADQLAAVRKQMAEQNEAIDLTVSTVADQVEYKEIGPDETSPTIDLPIEPRTLVLKQEEKENAQEVSQPVNLLSMQEHLAISRRQIAEANKAEELRNMTTDELIAKANKNGVHVQLPQGFKKKTAEDLKENAQEIVAVQQQPGIKVTYVSNNKPTNNINIVVNAPSAAKYYDFSLKI